MVLRSFLRVWLCLFTCIQLHLVTAQNANSKEENGTDDQMDISSGTISGKVVDGETKEGLSFVNIRLNGTLQGVSTQLDGSFEFFNLSPGGYNITITYVGYDERVIENIEVSSGENTELSIELLPATITTEAVVVTASRKRQAASQVPASVQILTSDQLNEKSITTFDQAVQDVPGVVITRSSGANVQAFSIRGASEVAGGGVGNRVLLLIDGRQALSPESGGALWNLVPVNSIGQIEVVKGAYSALYGSSAMGGVVNVITKKPTTEPQTRVNLNYGFYNKTPEGSGFEGYHDFHTIEVSHSRKRKNLSYLFDTGWKSDDGHREKSAFDLYNIYGKASYTIDKNRYIQVSSNINLINNDSPSTWLSKRKAHQVAAHRKDDFQKRNEYNADLHYFSFAKANLKYSSRFYYYRNASKYTYDSDPGNDSTNVNFGRQTVAESKVNSQRIGNFTQVDAYISSNQYLIGGVDVKWDHIVGLPDSISYGRHQVLSAGVFIQDEIKFSKRLTATLGVRYDYYQLLDDDFKDSNISPKIAFVYKVREDLLLRGLFAQAFRNPPIAERYIKFVQASGLRFQPNPNLQSEKLNVSLELGSKFHLTSNTSFDFAVFYNHYKNLIAFQQLSNPLEPLLFKVINLNKAIMQGFEVSLDQKFKDFLRFHANYTFLDARDISENRLNDVLAYKVKHTFNLSATANYNRFLFNINGRYRSKIEEVSIYLGSEPDATFLFNSKLSYSLLNKHSLYLSVNNIGNVQYEELERYRMPGRSYSIGAVFNL